MKLKAVLQLLPDPIVTTLGAGVKAEPWAWRKPTPIEKAEAALLNPDRLERVAAGVGDDGARLLRYLAAQGKQERRRRLEALEPEAPGALRKLLDQRLCFEHARPPHTGADAVIFLPEELAAGVPSNAEELTTLANLLDKQKTDYLGPLASRYGLDRGPKYRMIQDLKEKMLNPEVLERAIRDLTPKVRQVWDVCLQKGGALGRADLRVQGIQYSSFSSYGASDHPLNRLYRAGLLFPDREYDPFAAFVPSDLFALLRARENPAPLSAAAAPARATAWGDRLLGDIRLLAAYAAAGRLPLTQKNIPEKRALIKFAAAMGVPHGAYGLFLWMLAQPFLQHSPKGAPEVWGKEAGETLSRVLDQVLSAARWFENFPWRHMDWAPRGYQDIAMPARRMHLLSAMRACPDGWVEWKAFLSHLDAPFLRRADILSQVTSGGYAPEIPADPNEVAAAIVGETFLWCGLVETGHAAAGGGEGSAGRFTHFRITPLGRWLMNKSSRPMPGMTAPPIEETFRLLPTHEIQLPPRLNAARLVELLGMTELRGPSLLALTKDSLRAALDAGQTPERMIDFLKAHSSTGLPENVEIFLRDMGGKHGQIRIGYAGLFIEVADPFLLVELKSHRALKDVIVKEVGDRLALLSTDDPEALARKLKKLGYFPVVDIEPEDLPFMLPSRFRRY